MGAALDRQREDLAGATRAEQRRALILCAVVIPWFHLVDQLSVERHWLWVAVILRVTWSASLFGCAWLLDRWTTPHRRAALGLTAVFSAAHYLGLVAVTGGAASPAFPWCLALPLAVPLVVREEVWATLAAGLLMAVGSTALLWFGGGSPHDLVGWLLLNGASIFVAVLSSQVHVRAKKAEQALVEERLQALAKDADRDRQRAHEDRLAIVGTLAAGVAHEVNNPLAFLLENVDYLRDRCAHAGVAETEEIFQDVRGGLERIRRIVDDLRNFCRPGTDLVEQVSVDAVVEEALRIASLRLSRARVFVALPTLPALKGNRTRLVQVMVNLLINAADAVEECAGTIEVRGEPVGQLVRLSVEDDGPGISAEALPRLFQPFFTTKAPGKGTGLGLALSREYLERGGGRLWAENKPEGGARFVIECPKH
jgi:signal transduction histidine kinase